MSLRDQIAKADDARTEDVAVPEWGCSLRVHSMSNDERIQWELACTKKRKGRVDTDPYLMKVTLLVRVVHDVETDALVFSEKDCDMLGTKSAAVIDRLFDAACRLSGLTKEDEEDVVGK